MGDVFSEIYSNIALCVISGNWGGLDNVLNIYDLLFEKNCHYCYRYFNHFDFILVRL